jgi:HD superfamily phosphohydrolase
MMRHLKDINQKFVSFGRTDYTPVQIDEQDEKNVVLAGLMHDLGHGIYSHLFDRDFMPLILK